MTYEDYEFHCAAPDCAVEAHHVEDFFKCESCNALICEEHSHSPAGTPYFHFCEGCFRCAECGEAAWAMCDGCGALRCQAHMVAHRERMDDWNLGDWEYSCSGVCMAERRKPVVAEIITRKREVV
jgi:hypothetical protein